MSSLVMWDRGNNGGSHSPSQLTPNCLPDVDTFPSAILFSVLGEALEAGVGGSPWQEIGEAGFSEKGKSRPCKLPWWGERFTFASPGGFEHTFFEWT